MEKKLEEVKMRDNKKYVLQKDGQPVSYFETPVEAYEAALTLHIQRGWFYSVTEHLLTPFELMKDQFMKAYDTGKNVFGVAVQLPESTDYELIINSMSELYSKLKYYHETYDEELCHRNVDGLKIKHTAVGSSVAAVADKLAKAAQAEGKWH
ncbi:hypothetical protein HWB07_gp108 [Bacillus phage vB_BsuM-Goe3]|uniref:Uncharacterized protein n=1 Tax=Bacillus phage vB_BsuM-Goe3 TaxID=1933063 RepID=A0A217ERD1_BPGO3|nr:hypothetical protein HWB07_gp108 [Bacillus phage vB_BsuM-Goe3]APZ82662.1 hypothetical protein Goe3_c20100 [Bacillus phage vB_BsuM-Goe3]